MALYLIIAGEGAGTFVREIEAENIEEAAGALAGIGGDGFTAQIWCITGRARTITTTTSVSVEIGDPEPY
jgi:hypothetical protein